MLIVACLETKATRKPQILHPLISFSYSVSHQLSTSLLLAFISPEQSIALTNILHRNNYLGRLCLHTKLYVHTFFGHAYRAGRKLTSNNHLPEWYFNHRITITSHVSIIGKLNKTAPSSPYSVTENSKKNISVIR